MRVKHLFASGDFRREVLESPAAALGKTDGQHGTMVHRRFLPVDSGENSCIFCKTAPPVRSCRDCRSCWRFPCQGDRRGVGVCWCGSMRGEAWDTAFTPPLHPHPRTLTLCSIN